MFETARVSTGDITETVNATGRVTQVLAVSIGTQVTGTIKKIHLDYNDKVEKGRLLIELDREVHAARLSEAESDAEARSAELERAKAEFAREDADFKRREELFNAGYISKNEYEAALYGQAARKASLELAGAQLKKAEAALDIARENVQKTINRSPVDGVVLSRDVEEGQTVSANLHAPTLLAVVCFPLWRVRPPLWWALFSVFTRRSRHQGLTRL